MAKRKMPVQIYVCANEATGQVITGWLKSYDPDDEEGRGRFDVTDDRSKALLFADLPAAHALWTQPSTVRPLRADGQPNRPLTAYTIEIRPAELGTGVPWGRQSKIRGVTK